MADAAPDTVLDFAGIPVPARRGESIAAALTRTGLRDLRHLPDGSERGLFCGMGVCQDCVLDIDGIAARSCMTAVTGPHRLARIGRDPRPAAATPPIGLDDIPVHRPEILVIGAGAAGLSAATAAAEAGAAVVLLDERTRFGGQFLKQPTPAAPWQDDPQFAAGRALIDRATRAGVTLIGRAEVWGAFPPRDIAVLRPDGIALYRPRALIVATGAFERGVPFPGWTLPGVMTTGAAQTLARGEATIAGRRILIAGNGPLNLQVAVELARRGAHIAALVELAPAPAPSQAILLARMALAAPSLLRQGAALHWQCRRRRIPILHGQTLRSVAPHANGLRARIAPIASDAGQDFDVDAVCLGFGFQPANEILRALGCRHTHDPERGQLVTTRDTDGATSVDGVYAAGDCCGLGGAPAAIEEGKLAGWAAAAALGHATPAAKSRVARKRLARHRRFQSALWQLYAAPSLTTELATPDTPICRCEGVTLATVQSALADADPAIGEVKRRTRLGMGPCQGRYCAPILAAMLARRDRRPLDEMAFFAPQSPFKPLSIAALSRPAPTA